MPILYERRFQQATTLSQYLTQIMQERHLSIMTIARSTGIARQTLYAYLDGGRPNIKNSRKLAFYFGVSLGKIISLVYPDVKEVLVEAMVEAYLDLPDEGRRVAEDIIFTLGRHMGGREKNYQQQRTGLQ